MVDVGGVTVASRVLQLAGPAVPVEDLAADVTPPFRPERISGHRADVDANEGLAAAPDGASHPRAGRGRASPGGSSPAGARRQVRSVPPCSRPGPGPGQRGDVAVGAGRVPLGGPGGGVAEDALALTFADPDGPGRAARRDREALGGRVGELPGAGPLGVVGQASAAGGRHDCHGRDLTRCAGGGGGPLPVRAVPRDPLAGPGDPTGRARRRSIGLGARGRRRWFLTGRPGGSVGGSTSGVGVGGGGPCSRSPTSDFTGRAARAGGHPVICSPLDYLGVSFQPSGVLAPRAARQVTSHL
jgi:hypothetical protein